MINGNRLAGSCDHREQTRSRRGYWHGHLSAGYAFEEKLNIYGALACDLVWRLRIDLTVLRIEQRGRQAVELHLSVREFRRKQARRVRHAASPGDRADTNAEDKDHFTRCNGS